MDLDDVDVDVMDIDGSDEEGGGANEEDGNDFAAGPWALPAWAPPPPPGAADEELEDAPREPLPAFTPFKFPQPVLDRISVSPTSVPWPREVCSVWGYYHEKYVARCTPLTTRVTSCERPSLLRATRRPLSSGPSRPIGSSIVERPRCPRSSAPRPYPPQVPGTSA
jgi:hypothetical protein